MRLSIENQRIIRETVAEVFGPDAVVSVFGSRVNDEARGGDIDLLVESSIVIEQRERKLLQLVAKLQLRLGDQPFGVLLLDPATPKQPVHEQALRTGERL